MKHTKVNYIIVCLTVGVVQLELQEMKQSKKKSALWLVQGYKIKKEKTDLDLISVFLYYSWFSNISITTLH